jgi:hypothetical protein
MKWLRLRLLVVMSLFPLLLTACGHWKGSWGNAQLLAESAGYPRVGADNGGNLTAVWAQPTGFYASRYDAGAGWEMPRRIAGLTTPWSDLHLAVSGNGHAIAVWLHKVAGDEYVQAARYVPGAGWRAVEKLGAIGVPADAAIDDTGNAFVVTEDHSRSPRGMTIAAFTGATGWTDDRINYVDATTGHGYPKLSVNGSGNGFLLWIDGGSGPARVYVSQRSPVGWEVPHRLGSTSGNAARTNILADAAGNAMALWGQQEGTPVIHSYASRFTAGTGWSTATRIDTSTYDCIDQHLAVNADGNFYAVWSQRTASTPTDIYGNWYVPGHGWQEPRLVGAGGNGRHPRIAADVEGNVFAAWQQYDLNGPFPGKANIYASQASGNFQWRLPRPLTRMVGSARAPELAAGPARKATVVWDQNAGSVGGAINNGIFFSRCE